MHSHVRTHAHTHAGTYCSIWTTKQTRFGMYIFVSPIATLRLYCTFAQILFIGLCIAYNTTRPSISVVPSSFIVSGHSDQCMGDTDKPCDENRFLRAWRGSRYDLM